ncbi:hypothetical protein ABID76_005324 [Burkholderia ambifaria]
MRRTSVTVSPSVLTRVSAPMCSDAVAADGFQMDIAEVAQVHQVVVNQLIRRVVMVVAAAEPVLRIRVERIARRRAGRFSVRVGADPDPYDGVLFPHRIRRHARLRRNPVLAGNLHAGAAAVEQQAVIAAAQAAHLERAARQRQRFVAAAILQRTDFPGRQAEQHDRAAEQRARDGFVRQFR